MDMFMDTYIDRKMDTITGVDMDMNMDITIVEAE
jgi:hypothetical protein